MYMDFRILNLFEQQDFFQFSILIYDVRAHQRKCVIAEKEL